MFSTKKHLSALRDQYHFTVQDKTRSKSLVLFMLLFSVTLPVKHANNKPQMQVNV